MAYISIENFKFGMDRRRERVAGTPGTLWTLENAHITRGADIERSKKFVPAFNIPAGSRGLFSLNKQLYCFGSADLAGSMPLGVLYQRLVSPAGGALTTVVDTAGFSGKVYAIADFDDGGRYHFYDGTRVVDWDAIAAASSDYSTLAQFMAEQISADGTITANASGNAIEITAKVPGVPFTIAGSSVDHGGNPDQTITIATPQANVVETAETVATATITIDSGPTGSIDSVMLGAAALTAASVPWAATNDATAIRLAQQILNRTGVSGYSASVAGNVVTISALAGTGATPNGTALSVTTSGTIGVTASPTLSGGVTAVGAVAQVSTATFGGTFEADDAFTITLNAVPYKATGLASGTGRSLYVDFQRVWSPAASLWRYCKLTDPMTWNPATSGSDAGFLDVALDADGAENIICAARYQTYAAVYCETCVVLYTLDTDPANFARYMVLDNTSTDATHSVLRYGNNDVFHLDPTGVRSLRPVSITNAPFVSDVGNPIDTFVLEFLDTLTEEQRRAAVSAIEPRDGRFWLAVGERIFVLSFYPDAKISAWSYYEPGFTVEAFAKINKALYVRAGDTIYLYGGRDGQTYPGANETVPLVELPFLAANQPATKKGLTGFDAAFTNEWIVDVLIDPNREDKVIHIGVVKDITYGFGDIALPGQAPLVALRLQCTRAGRATLSMAQIHFQKQDQG